RLPAASQARTDKVPPFIRRTRGHDRTLDPMFFLDAEWGMERRRSSRSSGRRAHRGVRSRSAHARLRSWRRAAGGSRRKLGSKDRVLPCSDVSHEAYSHLVLAENVISRKRAVKCFSLSRERSRSRT